MSDGSIALLAGLLSGGFGLLGVFVGYVLEKHSSKKQVVSEAVFHVYEQLIEVVNNEIFWSEYPPFDEEALEQEMDKASEVMKDIMDTLAKTKGFPYLPEVLEAVDAVSDLYDVDTWEENYSSKYRFGLYRVTNLLQKKIDNKAFVKAFDRISEAKLARRIEESGLDPEQINERKRLLKKALKELKSL